MGFSRYHFSLEPQQEIEFIVSEEATYEDVYTNDTDLVNIIKNRFPIFLRQGLTDENFVNTVREIVVHRESIAALKEIARDNISERFALQWKYGSTVASPQIVDGKVQPRSLIPKSISDKIDFLLDLQNKKRDNVKLITTQKESIQKIFVNQNRLRENIKLLEKWNDSDLVKRYLRDFDLQEDVLNNTNVRISQLEAEDVRIGEAIQHLKLEIVNDAKRELESLTQVSDKNTKFSFKSEKKNKFREIRRSNTKS